MSFRRIWVLVEHPRASLRCWGPRWISYSKVLHSGANQEGRDGPSGDTLVPVSGADTFVFRGVCVCVILYFPCWVERKGRKQEAKNMPAWCEATISKLVDLSRKLISVLEFSILHLASSSRINSQAIIKVIAYILKVDLCG